MQKGIDMRLTGKIHSDNLHKRLEGYRKGMKRKDISPSMNPAYEDMSYVSHHELVYEKLGQLEDIEEELGIDLVTFFKIRKHCYDRKPIFIKDKDEITQSSCRVELCYESVAVYTGDYGADSYPLEDYGKTWALTKEELL